MAVRRRTSDDGLENWERLTLDPVAADDAFVYHLTILPSGKVYLARGRADQIAREKSNIFTRLGRDGRTSQIGPWWHWDGKSRWGF